MFSLIPHCAFIIKAKTLKGCSIMNIAFLLTPKSQVAYIYEDSTFRQALEKLRHHGYSAVPVLTRDGKYAGTLSEGDFLWSMLEIGGASLSECEGLRVADIKKTDRNPAVHITSDTDELMSRALGQNFIPVVDDRGCFMGIVTRRAIINAFIGEANEEAKIS